MTVACTINDLQPLSASEILWYKDSPEEALPGALSQVVGNSTTSRLTLSVVTDEDTGTYYCALPSDGKDVSLYKSSRVVVGSKLNNSHFHIISLTGGKGRVKDWLRRRRRRGREGIRHDDVFAVFLSASHRTLPSIFTGSGFGEKNKVRTKGKGMLHPIESYGKLIVKKPNIKTVIQAFFILLCNNQSNAQNDKNYIF